MEYKIQVRLDKVPYGRDVTELSDYVQSKLQSMFKTETVVNINDYDYGTVLGLRQAANSKKNKGY